MGNDSYDHIADSDVLAFHDRMLAKGDSFYGVAVQPPAGMEDEVAGELERILAEFGYSPIILRIGGHLVFEGEYAPEAMESVRKYLEGIERQAPSAPSIIRGNYFQMSAYKWLDQIVKRQKFREAPISGSTNNLH